MIETIVPVILTRDEESNIGKALASLSSFREVVIVDSGSQDETRAIAKSFSNTRWFERAWTGFGDQWTFGFEQAKLRSEWVLALDADMEVSPELAAELADISRNESVDGVILRFEYRIRGTPLAGSLYPPQLRFARTLRVRAATRGHAHELCVQGRTVVAQNRLIHDDRKPLESFVQAQIAYSRSEVGRLYEGESSLRFRARLRRGFVGTPIVVWLLAWISAGGPFRGAAASRYALERLVYEALLRYRVDDRALMTELDRKRDTGVEPTDVST